MGEDGFLGAVEKLLFSDVFLFIFFIFIFIFFLKTAFSRSSLFHDGDDVCSGHCCGHNVGKINNNGTHI